MQLCQGRLGTEDRAQGLTAGTRQIAVLQPAGERQQGRGKCTPRITEALLREVYLPWLELGKDTTALTVHNPSRKWFVQASNVILQMCQYILSVGIIPVTQTIAPMLPSV